MLGEVSEGVCDREEVVDIVRRVGKLRSLEEARARVCLQRHRVEAMVAVCSPIGWWFCSFSEECECDKIERCWLGREMTPSGF